MTDLPLGRSVPVPDRYAPEILVGVDRRQARDRACIREPLPFHGFDFWNAWELTWLTPGGPPAVAVAEIVVPAESPRLVESKSLKLYLGSFAMTEIATDELANTLRRDIENTVGTGIDLRLVTPNAWPAMLGAVPGACIDDHPVACAFDAISPSALSASTATTVTETLYSHLLRSLCPVTGQPDFGTVVIDYHGPRIDPAGLLRYIASFRCHQDFHEACVERMFMDIADRCRPTSLTVSARFTRRGGIDINPVRSSQRIEPSNRRIWRQ